MNYEISGLLVSRSQVEQVTPTFTKRTFVLYVKNERDERFDDYIEFQLTNDRCSLVDGFNKNDRIRVSFNINGKKYISKTTGKTAFFNSLTAWKVEPDYASEDRGFDNHPQPADQPSNTGYATQISNSGVETKPKMTPRVDISNNGSFDDDMPF